MNLYDLLGISREATLTEIRAAYRAKAKNAHPDNGGSGEAFRALREAHDVLTDPKRRARYDATGDFTSDLDAEEKIAVALVGELVQSMIDQFTNHTEDPIKHMCRILDENIAEVPKSIAQMKRKKANAERLLKRFSSKGKSRVILAVLEATIANLGAKIASEQTRINVLKRAKEIVLEHDFKVDETGSAWETFTSSAGTIFTSRTTT